MVMTDETELDKSKNTDIELNENLENNDSQEDLQSSSKQDKQDYSSSIEPMVKLISALKDFNLEENVEDIKEELSNINSYIDEYSRQLNRIEIYRKSIKYLLHSFVSLIYAIIFYLVIKGKSLIEIHYDLYVLIFIIYTLMAIAKVVFVRQKRDIINRIEYYYDQKYRLELYLDTKKYQNSEFKNQNLSEKYVEQNQDLYTAVNNRTEIYTLNRHIKSAQLALAKSLSGADKRITEYSITARIIGISAIILIILDLSAIIYFGFHYEIFFNSLEKFKEFGAWALTLFSFPILIVFSIAVTLLRHQKKLLDEVRHYSGEKRQIELYSGLLEASQYVATSLNDPQASATYVKETFDKIRDRILSEQPHTNTAGSAVEKEEYSSSLEPLIKVISDMIAKSEVKK